MELLRFYVLLLICAIRVSAQIETSISICTDIHIDEKTAKDDVPTRIYDCLQRGRVYLVSKSIIEQVVGEPAREYYDALLKYEAAHEKAAENNKDVRRELRSLQREIITMSARLRFFATGFNVPDFINLSDGRRLRLMQEHVNNVKDTLFYLRAVPPLIDTYKSHIRNLTFVSDAQFLVERDERRQEFEDSLVNLSAWIREQYV